MDTTRTTTIPNSAVEENPSIIHATNQPSSASGADVRLPISEVMLSCIASAVDAAFALHNQANGSTVSLVHGNLADGKFFSVSIYPERTIEFWERPSWQELFDFAKANLDLLLKPAHALGTWFNDWGCTHVVDVVICVPDRDAAVDLGRRFDQTAVFDLEARREIPILRTCREFNTRLAKDGNPQ